MDLQFYGANCLSVSYKGTRIVVDDNLSELGAKSIIKENDVSLFTSRDHTPTKAHLTFDSPGEYEASDISIIGIAARSNIEDSGDVSCTMFKLICGDQSLLVTGHIYPQLSDKQLENVGHVDVLVVPVGGNGYTVDAVGALQIVKAIEPRLLIPVHYADKGLHYPVPQQELAVVLKELAMDPKETTTKYRLKLNELSDITQLVVLERS
jgi:L-ascorbate metabolism protein UlaG (beta-lactamase superfamily)